MSEVSHLPNRLLNLSAIEAAPSYLSRFENASKEVRNIKGKESNIVNSAINLTGSEDDIKRLQVGLIYIALTDPTAIKWAIQDIVLISRDNLLYALSELTRVIAENWPKFQPDVHKNVLRIIDELFSTRGANIDILMMHLYRRMQSGDLSQINLWLVQSLLDILTKYKESLLTDRKHGLLPLTVFHFLRIIPDHHSETNPYITQIPSTSRPPGLNNLFQREAKFVVELIRANFDRCAGIGREFIRMLYYVSRLPPFQKLWQDIFNDLPSLSSTIPHVNSILANPTALSYTQTLISYEMEQYTLFMVSNVHIAPNFPTRRYQEMFIKNVHFEHCALSLFFPWYIFQKNETIMNIEPAVLIIINGLMNGLNTHIYARLLEFFMKAANTFHPSLTTKFVQSIRTGITESIALGVVRSVGPLMEDLSRFRPDLCREFSTMLGPTFEPDIPLSPTPGITVAQGLPEPSSALKRGSGDGGGGSSSIDEVSSITFNFDGEMKAMHYWKPAVLTPVTLIPTSFIAEKSSTPSTGGVPIDPRLRRNGLPTLLPGSRPTGPKTQPRPPSPTEARFSPPPSPPAEFGSRKVKPIMQFSEDKAQIPSPKVRAVTQKLSGRLERPNSPEFNIDANITMDSMQQRINDLRRRFTAYQFRYTHKMKTDVNVIEILNKFDGEIHKHLEKFISTARAVGLLKETDIALTGDSRSSTPSSISDDPGLADVCESMQDLIDAVLNDDFSDDLDIIGRVADVISQVCLPLFDVSMGYGDRELLERSQISTALLPSIMPITQEQIDGSLTSPVFVPLRSLCEMNRNNAKREILLLLLTEILIRQPRIGYHLLYFLAVSNVNDDKMIAYRHFCASSENPGLLDCLYRDLQLLADDNGSLFSYLLPSIYNVFAAELANKAEFIRLIVSKADSGQVNYLTSEILRGHLNLFPRSDITDVLKASLDWSTTEQSFFWLLVGAHELPTKHFLPLINLVNVVKHSEACSQLLLILQLEKPTIEIVRLLLTRAASSLNSTDIIDDANADDILSVTSLHYWGRPGGIYAQRFAEILSSMITSSVNALRPAGDAEDGSGNAGSGRKRAGTKTAGNGSDRLSFLVSILTHLECMRRNCKNIAMLQLAELQASLQQVIVSPNVPSNVKDRFAELLSLVEREVLPSTGHSSRSSTSGRGGRQDTGGETGSSKGGHSLRNLDSRRAAEVERRRNAAVVGVNTGTRKKQARKKSDEDGDGEDSSDNNNSKTATSNNDTGSNIANSDDEEDDSEGALAIDDSLDTSANIETDDREAGSSSSDSPTPARNSNTEISISSSESDEDDRPAARGQKRPIKRRAPTASKKQQPPAKKPASKSRKAPNPVPDSDDDEDDDDDEDKEDSGSEDAPRVTGPSKRKKTVSRRLLDD
ncbi:hypothetical protein Aperf_G00000042291 [Anoplocephala perfoliata]